MCCEGCSEGRQTTAPETVVIVSVKKFVRFLSYLPVILVALLGAYIVFHMWRLSENYRHPTSRAIQQTTPGNAQAAVSPSEQAKETK
jgi:hypothetical protein